MPAEKKAVRLHLLGTRGVDDRRPVRYTSGFLACREGTYQTRRFGPPPGSSERPDEGMDARQNKGRPGSTPDAQSAMRRPRQVQTVERPGTHDRAVFAERTHLTKDLRNSDRKLPQTRMGNTAPGSTSTRASAVKRRLGDHDDAGDGARGREKPNTAARVVKQAPLRL
jgi:hypothetical protein